MRDWKRFVSENLSPLFLGAERESEIVDEMAQHLEAVYEEALADGATEEEAFERASAHVKDWQLLESELIRAQRPITHPLINSGFIAEARIESRLGLAGGTMQSLI